jgi:hypothetical protein
MRRIGPQQKRLAVRGGNSGGNLGRDANHKFALSWSRQAMRRCGQIFHREIGKRATSAQLIAGDLNSQHGNNSAPIGKADQMNNYSQYGLGRA